MVGNAVEIVFFKNLNFFIFSYFFNMLMSKIFFLKKYYFNIFSSEKYFEPQLLSQSQTPSLYFVFLFKKEIHCISLFFK